MRGHERQYQEYFGRGGGGAAGGRQAQHRHLQRAFAEQRSPLQKTLEQRERDLEARHRETVDTQSALVAQMRAKREAARLGQRSEQAAAHANSEHVVGWAGREQRALYEEQLAEQKRAARQAQQEYHDYLAQQLKWRERQQRPGAGPVDKEYAERVREHFEEFSPQEQRVNGFIALSTERQRQGQPIFRSNLTSRMHDQYPGRLAQTPLSLPAKPHHANPISNIQ